MNPVKVDLLAKVDNATHIKDAKRKQFKKHIQHYYIGGKRDEKALIKQVESFLNDKRHEGSAILPTKHYNKVSFIAYKKWDEAKEKRKSYRFVTIDGIKYRAQKKILRSTIDMTKIELNKRYMKGTPEYKMIVDSLDRKSHDELEISIGISGITVIPHNAIDENSTHNNRRYNTVDMFIDDVDELATKLKASNHDFITNRFIANEFKIKGLDIVSALEANEPDECCLNAFLNCYESTKRFALNRHVLLQILNKTENDIKDGISILEMSSIFQHFNLSAKIYNSYHKKIYHYEGDPKVKTFYAMVKDKHMYVMNSETHAITHYPEYSSDKDELLKVSTNYKLKDEKKMPDIHYHIINNYNDVIQYVCSGLDREKVHNLIMNDGKNLYELYVEAKQNGCDPVTIMKNNDIMKLVFKFNKVSYLVHSLESLILPASHVDTLPDLDYSYLQLYQKANYKLQAEILNNKYISQYDNNDLKMFETASTRPQTYLLNDVESVDNMYEIDRRRSYASTLMRLDNIPVFNVFDNMIVYENEPIEDFTLYYVTGIINYFMQNEYNIVYGQYLKQFITNPKLKIIAFKKPSNIVSVDYKKIVNKFLKNKFSDDDSIDNEVKKQTVNIAIGLLQMRKNKREFNKIFENKEDAIKAKILYGGSVSYLEEGLETLVEKIERYTSDLDQEGDISERYTTTKETHIKEDGKKFYVHKIENEADLKNGFCFVKELLMQEHNYYMFSCLEKLKANNIAVYSIKTDSLTINKQDYDKVKSLLSFGPNFGQWRLHKTENVLMPSRSFIPYKNKCIFNEHVKPVLNSVSFADEYNIEPIIEHIKNIKRVMIRSAYPGGGKSFIPCAMGATMNTPTNKLAQQFIMKNLTANTMNKFFGVGVGDNDYVTKCDDSNEIICFDESAFLDISFLTRIKRYVDSHPEKIFIGTGDTLQLENFNIHVNNISDKDKYIDHIINSIFGNNEIMLKVCKRFEKEEDRQRLKQLKDDIFVNKIDRISLIKQFKTTKTIATKGICYYNETCENVNTAYRINKNFTEGFMIGEKIVCKERFKADGVIYNQNFEYEIVSKTETNMTVKDVATNEQYSLLSSAIYKFFDYDYANTCHSAQGSSFDEKITIYDWNSPHVTDKWLWVAITRARRLEDVYFYVGPYIGPKFDIDKKLTQKIANYKKQDRDANRDIDEENYITKEVLKTYLNATCYICNEKLNIKTMTADRIDNEICHTIDNCSPCCNDCNCAKSNK